MKKILVLMASLLALPVTAGEVTNPYLRASAPGAPNSAGFMVISNPTDQELALVRAEADLAKKVELHNHVNDNGVMRMRQVEKILIPAQGQVELKPGGYHVMMMGLNKQLKPGEQETLTLHFSDGSSQTLSVPVKKVQPMMQAGGHKMQHDMAGGMKKEMHKH
ncbi:copper chaperone PCu(A)C [Motiliproteus sp.]|uniref:copper chaperone PCu(A)C n=1 Tax=Motiliproteus sp. TaxID=1898955 RepID=UPI003BAA928D